MSKALLLTSLLLPPFAVACAEAQAESDAGRPVATPTAASLTAPSDAAAEAVEPAAEPAANMVSHPGLDTISLPEVQADATAVLKDTDVEGYRVELLAMAFEGVSEMPLMPHVKTRSRLQEEILEAFLELGQRQTAAGYVPRIDNWRRGLALASLARACGEAGASAQEIEPFLAGARGVANGGEELLKQAWRRDRILAEIGAAYEVVGESQKAMQAESGITEDSEAGKVDLVRAQGGDEAECDRQLAMFDRVLEIGTLDRIRNAVASLLALYDRFYDDEVRSGLIEAKLQKSVVRIPRFIGIELMHDLALISHGHGDTQRGLEAIKEAEKLMNGANWTPQERIQLHARFAGTRAKLGDLEAARVDAAESMKVFEAEREGIMDAWRAGPLRELAETWVTLEDKAQALEVYRICADEGALNVNARPRAMDLAATCISMALHDVEPDEALWKKLKATRDGFEEPW